MKALKAEQTVAELASRFQVIRARSKPSLTWKNSSLFGPIYLDRGEPH